MKLDYSHLGMSAASAGLITCLFVSGTTNPWIWTTFIVLDILLWFTYFAQKERGNV
jgi:hypothetical protein